MLCNILFIDKWMFHSSKIYLIQGALIQGLKRATFSNEAGIGSAAIAHSAVKTKEPITEGLVEKIRHP